MGWSVQLVRRAYGTCSVASSAISALTAHPRFLITSGQQGRVRLSHRISGRCAAERGGVLQLYGVQM